MASSQGGISRERLEAPPGPIYTENVLRPSYDFMLEHYFEGLIETNKAWTVMLQESGIITAATAKDLLNAVATLAAAGRGGMGEFNPKYEYFYSTMEHYLTGQVGETISGEINIGRTRPEPLARLAIRDRLEMLLNLGLDLQKALLNVAERERDTVIPMGTHMQHGQVATVGHYLLGTINQLQRDSARLLAAYKTVNHCTLGCGALAGSSYAIDRERVAELLGFEGLIDNTNDCVGAGDYALEAASATANMMIGISRLCQDLYTWHTQEFGYLVIGDDYSGSSSLMPQKKNPYPFEYIRTQAATAVGQMSGLFTVLHNTNFQDIKDVEEGLPPGLFQQLDESSRSLRLLAGVLETVEFKPETMRDQAARHFATATELASVIHRATEHSYRTAHRIVGHLVLLAMKAGLQADQVGIELVQQAARDITGAEISLDEAAVRGALDPEAFVRAHNVRGGPAPQAMAEAIDRTKAMHQNISADVQALTKRRTEAATALQSAVAGLRGE
ncbi:MAG: argininosuccinate lyase [Gammaproteobacteria bacterium]|nr:argininosuccinate lyase [Gammaproteobacteria bacterium]